MRSTLSRSSKLISFAFAASSLLLGLPNVAGAEWEIEFLTATKALVHLRGELLANNPTTAIDDFRLSNAGLATFQTSARIQASIGGGAARRSLPAQVGFENVSALNTGTDLIVTCTEEITQRRQFHLQFEIDEVEIKTSYHVDWNLFQTKAAILPQLIITNRGKIDWERVKIHGFGIPSGLLQPAGIAAPNKHILVDKLKGGGDVRIVTGHSRECSVIASAIVDMTSVKEKDKLSATLSAQIVRDTWPKSLTQPNVHGSVDFRVRYKNHPLGEAEVDATAYSKLIMADHDVTIGLLNDPTKSTNTAFVSAKFELFPLQSPKLEDATVTSKTIRVTDIEALLPSLAPVPAIKYRVSPDWKVTAPKSKPVEEFITVILTSGGLTNSAVVEEKKGTPRNLHLVATSDLPETLKANTDALEKLYAIDCLMFRSALRLTKELSDLLLKQSSGLYALRKLTRKQKEEVKATLSLEAEIDLATDQKITNQLDALDQRLEQLRKIEIKLIEIYNAEIRKPSPNLMPFVTQQSSLERVAALLNLP